MPGLNSASAQRDLRRQIGHWKAGRDYIVDRVGHGRQMFRSHQQPVLPGARLGNAVWPREHDAVSDRETGTAGILDDTGAFVAEHERRLGPRVSTRQDRVIERRDAGGGDVNQHSVLCRLRLRQFDLPQPAIARESLRLDRTHRHSP